MEDQVHSHSPLPPPPPFGPQNGGGYEAVVCLPALGTLMQRGVPWPYFAIFK